MAGTARGQASLEYLVLSLVALALLSVSVFALASLRGYADKAAGDFSFRSSALSLANAISEVCALGSGNGRSLALGAPVSVEYADSVVRISGGSAPVLRPARCAVDAADGLHGIVYVKNEGGRITLTER